MINSNFRTIDVETLNLEIINEYNPYKRLNILYGYLAFYFIKTKVEVIFECALYDLKK